MNVAAFANQSAVNPRVFDEGQGPFFISAEQALLWAANGVRTRRFAKLSSIYLQILHEPNVEHNIETAATNTLAHNSFKAYLPTDSEGRYALALAIMAEVHALEAENARWLLMMALGDWESEGRLHAALVIQERMRREGIRVRLSYHYSYRRLGEMCGHDHKYAQRKVASALEELSARLSARGIVWEG
jgi:hypothetical protein